MLSLSLSFDLFNFLIVVDDINPRPLTLVTENAQLQPQLQLPIQALIPPLAGSVPPPSVMHVAPYSYQRMQPLKLIFMLLYSHFHSLICLFANMTFHFSGIKGHDTSGPCLDLILQFKIEVKDRTRHWIVSFDNTCKLEMLKDYMKTRFYSHLADSYKRDFKCVYGERKDQRGVIVYLYVLACHGGNKFVALKDHVAGYSDHFSIKCKEKESKFPQEIREIMGTYCNYSFGEFEDNVVRERSSYKRRKAESMIREFSNPAVNGGGDMQQSFNGEESTYVKYGSGVKSVVQTEDTLHLLVSFLTTHQIGKYGSSAQYNLGICYANGLGVVVDCAVAAKYYRFAADAGHMEAQYNLGRCYAEGFGVVRDDEQAARYYALASAQGHAPSSFNLGVCLHLGTGVAVNESEAVRCYQLASEQGYADAQFALGSCYANGTGVSADPIRAAQYYALAADQACAGALCALGLCYLTGSGVAMDSTQAVKYYRLAAGQGHAEAQFNLGMCYSTATGVSKNDVEAVKFFRLAADQGHVTSQCSLGISYQSGCGVSVDTVEALKYYCLAADQGDECSRLHLNVLLQSLQSS